MSDNPRDGDAGRLRQLMGASANSEDVEFLLMQVTARDAALFDANTKIKARDRDIERFQSSVSSARAEIDRLNAVTEQLVISLDSSHKETEVIQRQRTKIVRLQSTSAQRVIEAAREALQCTMEMSKVVGISVDALNSLVTLQHALTEYDAGCVTKENEG